MWYADPTAYFPRHGVEAQGNANEIYAILTNNWGYDFYAVMAILANIYAESTFNPWLWEGRTIRAKSSTDPQYYRNFDGGYGLIQWTPWPPTPHPNTQPYIDSPTAQGYVGYSPNFSDQAGTVLDGMAQTEFIVTDMFAAGNWFPCSTSYYATPFANVGIDIYDFRSMTASQFKDGTFQPKTPTNYIGAFELNYLRPQAGPAAARFSEMLNEFDFWYEYFSGSPPPPPPTSSNLLLYSYHKRKKGGYIPI